MTGQPRSDDSDRRLSYKALRSKLNTMKYYQPLSEESLDLAERLLADILKSAERSGALRKQVDEREREAVECEVELLALRREHPRLLKENTELHKRLLGDSFAQEGRRGRWQESVNLAQAKLSDLVLRQEQERHRGTELRRAADCLRSQLDELQRDDPDVAHMSTRPKAPSSTIDGQASVPIAQAHAEESTSHATDTGDAPDDGALASRVQELLPTLATARAKRIRAAASLERTEQQAAATQAFVNRLREHIGDGASSSRERSAESQRAEELHLASQADFLQRRCDLLQGGGQRLGSELAAAREETSALSGQAAELRRSLANVQRLTRRQEDAAARGTELLAERPEDRERRMAALTEAASERAELMASHRRLEALLADARLAEEEGAAEGRTRLHELGERLDAARAENVGQGEAYSEGESQMASRLRSEHQRHCASLSTKLAALRTHEASQQILLQAREEEASASTEAHREMMARVGAVKVELRDLEASVKREKAEVAMQEQGMRDATADIAEARRECEDGQSVLAVLRESVEERSEAFSKAATKADLMRSSTLQMETQTLDVRQEEHQLKDEVEQLRQALGVSEEQFGIVQRSHRDLSSGMNRTLTELHMVRMEQRSELATENEQELTIAKAKEAILESLARSESLAKDGADEVRLLEESLSAQRAAGAELETKENDAQEKALARLRELEPNVESTRQELSELAGLAPRLQAEVGAKRLDPAAVAATAARGEAHFVELAGVLRRQEEEDAAELARISSLNARREDMEALAARLSAEAGWEASSSSSAVASRSKDNDARQEELRRSKAALEERVKERAAEQRSLEAALAVKTRRLRDLGAAERTAVGTLRELQERQGQFATLLRGLEQTREELVSSLRDATSALDDERRLHAESREGPPGAKARIEELTAEGARLRQAVESAGSDQEELFRYSASQAQNLEGLRLQSVEAQAMRAELQWKLDRLRHTADLQQGELAACTQEAEHALAETRALEAEVQAAAADAMERRREAKLGMEDLVHMTRENQLLHDQLLQARQQESALVAATRERHAAVLPRMQELRGTEMQRENVIRVYQQVLDERRRNEVAIATLTGQSEQAKFEAEVLEERLAALEESTEQVRARMVLGNADLMAVRVKLSSAARSLEMQELARDEAGAERARLMQVVGARQAAISGAFLSGSVAGAEVDGLRREAESLQQDLHDAQFALAEALHQREEDAKRQARLQGMLGQQRREQQQLDTERALLQELLRNTDRQGPGVLEATATSASGALGATGAASLNDLRETLAQQAALLTEMAGEERGLAAEVERLTSEISAG